MTAASTGKELTNGEVASDGFVAARNNGCESWKETTGALHLREVTELDPGNETGWIWLAWVAESPTSAADYLRRAIACDPDNPAARGDCVGSRP